MAANKIKIPKELTEKAKKGLTTFDYDLITNDDDRGEGSFVVMKSDMEEMYLVVALGYRSDPDMEYEEGDNDYIVYTLVYIGRLRRQCFGTLRIEEDPKLLILGRELVANPPGYKAGTTLAVTAGPIQLPVKVKDVCWDATKHEYRYRLNEVDEPEVGQRELEGIVHHVIEP